MKKALLFVTVLVILSPMSTWACAMCQAGGTKENVAAWEGITLFLALMPLISVGSIFYWIYAKSKRG
jgi:hypothetical protein